MKSVLFILLLLISTLAAAEKREAIVVKVEDGDTLLVNISGTEERIQLLGIDAPEDRRNPKFEVDLKRTGLDAERLLALGKAATTHLRSLLQPGQKITLAGDLGTRDRYDRLPAEAFAPSGLSLNVAMVADGYARVLPSDGSPQALRQRLEAVWMQVNQNRPGLWTSQSSAFAAWLSAQR